jgi:hypothetical protein
MKKQKFILLAIAVGFAMYFSSCTKDELTPNSKDDILPARFSVKVPGSITAVSKKAYSSEDTLQGGGIYQHLKLFIAVGDGAGKVVEGIIGAIRYYHINRPLSMTYQSDEDGRSKNLVVFEKVSFEGADWDFQMNISDAESEGNPDAGLGLQIFWNNNPIKGIAILKPYNINRNENKILESPVYKIEYSEGGESGYDSYMVVSIADLSLANPLTDPYSLKTLKMCAGKKGAMVDVFGNTNHPNAKFFTSDAGFNWAFVASADESANLAVAEVGLPPSNLDNSTRSVLLEEYSIKNVFTNQILSVWPGIDPGLLDGYLHNAGAPGYFNESGFLQGGTSPGSEYDEVEARIELLKPFNPSEISSMEISFKLN